MRKFYSLLLTVTLFFGLLPESKAQSVIIDGGNSSSSWLYTPIYTYSASPRSFRSAAIYPQSSIAGMPSGSSITQLQYSRDADGTSLPAGNNLKLYLMNTALNDWGTGSIPWDVSGAVLIYDGDPSAIIGSTSGYKAFPAMQPFTYTGNSLVVFSEYSQVNQPTSTISWHYSTPTTVPAYAANQVKHSYNSNTTMPTSLATSNSNHANIIIDYMLAGPCTGPPAAGMAEAMPATAVCSGSPVSLNLSGNSSGTGQTYQWQQSATPGGPYTSIDTPAVSAFKTVNPTTTTYYIAEVICSGDTSYSSEVAVTVNPLISGNFTINNGLPSGSGNFQTFTEAINYLRCGINGPVWFEVANGVYNEQVTIPEIPGASATNTVTINGNMATIAFSSSTSAERTGIVLNGADYITIDSLYVDATAGTYGWGILLTNGANHNVISNCTINTSISSTSQNYMGIVISGSTTSGSSSGDNGNYNLITRNTVTGGYYGISAYGSTSTYNQGNVISSNKVIDYYYYSIYSYGNSNITISKNELTRPTRTSLSSYNLYIASSNGVLAEKNRMHNLFGGDPSNTSTFYNIYISTSSADTAPSRLQNNLVYNIAKSGGAIYGVYALGRDYWSYYHNTIVLDDGNATSGTTYGMYVYGDSVRVKNNIIYITRGGTGTKYALYFSSTGVTESNNNVLYVNSSAGTNGIGYHSVGYTTLADWQASPQGYGQQSVSEDPMFLSPGSGNFKPMQPNINNIGDNVGVATDILDSARLITAPDPGAFEFQLPACVNPPSTGMTTSSTMSACSGAEFTLDLVGNSVGEFQVYHWQASPDNVTYTNIGSAQTIPAFITSQTQSTWYRAMVTCSGGAPEFSDGVQVITPSFVSGTFTINSGLPTGSGNFQSFTDAINHIRCGINGPVVFNVMPGSNYMEQVIMPAIAGTSPTNTITINGNGAMITYTSTDAAERAIIKLDGTDYVTIDSLYIMATGSAATEYGYGIQLVNNADHNTITSNIITVTTSPATTSSSAFSGIVVNSATSSSPTATGDSQCDSNYIANNRIMGGYAGITLVANGTTDKITGNVVMNNIIQDFYIYGIYLNGNEGAVVERNDISRVSRSSISTFYGVYMSTGNVGVKVSRNRIHDSFNGNTASTSASYGVYTSGSDATTAMPNVISNNMVYGFNNSGTQYGFYNSSSDSTLYYYNSVLFDGPATTSTTYDTRGFYQTTTASGLEYKNNIVVISRAGVGENHAIYMNAAATTFDSDHNDFYVPTTTGTLNNFGYYGGTQYATLSDWQTGTSHDLNSYSVAPMFIAPNNLHLQPGSPVADKGTAVSVLVDYDGDARDANLPEIGADERPLVAGVDLQTIALVSPMETMGCYTTDTLAVQIKNNSTSAINFDVTPATVTVYVTGAVNATYSTVIDSGMLASSATMDVVMQSPSDTIDMSTPGVYTFNAQVAAPGDANTANDAMPPVNLTRLALDAGSVSAASSQICIAGKPNLYVQNAQGYNGLQWQESTSAGSGFSDVQGAMDSTFTPSSDITQNMYYRLTATCGTEVDSSTVQMITVNKPMVTATTIGERCGSGSVTMSATGSGGSSINWYAEPTGGSPLANGNTFTTNISSDTTFYAAASEGGASSNAAAIVVTEMDLGTTTDQLEIQNVSPYPVDVTGWKVAVSASYTTITSVNSTVQTLSGMMNPGEMKTWSDATGTNYWGSNILWNPGQQGWAAILDNNNNLVDIVFVDWPATDIQSASITIDGATISPSTKWSGDGVDVTNATNGMSASRMGNMDNNNLSDFNVIPFTIGTNNPGLTLPFSGFGCESARVAVAATITECPVPVTLLDFKGEKKGAINKLEWTTVTEIDNAGFELQRSADGNNFGRLTYVASKAVNGNSTAALRYTFDDVRPFAGNSYYRLKQIDKDGKATFSSVVLIKGGKVNALVVSALYPNPVKNSLNVSVISPSAKKLNMVVTDLTGKAVMQLPVQVKEGDNLFALPVNQLAAGTYFLKAICDDGCNNVVSRFVKY